MQEFDFYSPQTLSELTRTLAEVGGRLVAGGTDVIPQMRVGRFRAERLIDLSRLDELRFVEQQNGIVRIGALSTYADIIATPLLQERATALVQAASVVGAPQTRQRGTLGGNIGNASPAADTLPPLLVLNAEVTLASVGGMRTIPLADLLQGPGKTRIAGNEVVHHIKFAQLPDAAKTLFLRLGNRAGMAVSVASVAIALVLNADEIAEDARIALGAVAPTAIRCPKAEAVLIARPLTNSLVEEAARTAVQECSPIDDIRGTAEYRKRAVYHLVRRALHTAARRA